MPIVFAFLLVVAGLTPSFLLVGTSWKVFLCVGWGMLLMYGLGVYDARHPPHQSSSTGSP